MEIIAAVLTIDVRPLVLHVHITTGKGESLTIPYFLWILGVFNFHDSQVTNMYASAFLMSFFWLFETQDCKEDHTGWEAAYHTLTLDHQGSLGLQHYCQINFFFFSLCWVIGGSLSESASDTYLRLWLNLLALFPVSRSPSHHRIPHFFTSDHICDASSYKFKSYWTSEYNGVQAMLSPACGYSRSRLHNPAISSC